jgi:hypothetical protein
VTICAHFCALTSASLGAKDCEKKWDWSSRGVSEGCGTGRSGWFEPDKTWVEIDGDGTVSVSSVGADREPEKLMVMLGIKGAGAATVAEGGKTTVWDGGGSMYGSVSFENPGGGTASATDQHNR